MAKTKWLKPVLAYHSNYGGESLRANASTALQRITNALRLCATHARPVSAKLEVYDEQSEALFAATSRDPEPDEEADALANRGEHGEVSPLVAIAEQQFGPGEPHRFGQGVCGDLWQTGWSLEADELDAAAFESKWRALAAFVDEHGGAPDISWSHGHRNDEKASDPALALELVFEPMWTAVGSDEPVPLGLVDGDGGSRIIVFLSRRSSAIFDMCVPFHAVDEAFAQWEQALCRELGVDLGASRWQLEFFSERGWEHGHKHEQGRYRRFDFTEEGRNSAPPKGKWDKPLDALTANRVKSSVESAAHNELLELPLGPVAHGLMARMAAVKGAALERSASFLQDLVHHHADRRPMAAPLAWVFDNPPPSKQIRQMGYALGKAGGDAWFLDLCTEQLAAKKVTTGFWQFFEEHVIFTDVMTLLHDNRNQRGIDNWNASQHGPSGMRSYGIGLTQLRKLAKKIGWDSDLAVKLWTSDWYDARVLALLIDDPKTITREQAETQVEQLQGGMLAHVFSSCDATLAKAPFVRELADEWMVSDDPVQLGL